MCEVVCGIAKGFTDQRSADRIAKGCGNDHAICTRLHESALRKSGGDGIDHDESGAFAFDPTLRFVVVGHNELIPLIGASVHVCVVAVCAAVEVAGQTETVS